MEDAECLRRYAREGSAVFTNYVLQQNSAPGTTNWVPDSDAVNLVGGNYQVTVGPATNSMFYRLAQP